MPLQGSLTVERMCQLAGASRAGFYRYLQGSAPREEDMAVRARVQEVVLANRRRYGCLRVTAELRQQGLRLLELAQIVEGENRSEEQAGGGRQA